MTHQSMYCFCHIFSDFFFRWKVDKFIILIETALPSYKEIHRDHSCTKTHFPAYGHPEDTTHPQRYQSAGHMYASLIPLKRYCIPQTSV